MKFQIEKGWSGDDDDDDEEPDSVSQ